MAFSLPLRSSCSPYVGSKDAAFPQSLRAVPNVHYSHRARQSVVLRAAVQTTAPVESLRLPRWEQMFDVLTDKGVKTIRPTEAADLLNKKGYVSEHLSSLCIETFPYNSSPSCRSCSGFAHMPVRVNAHAIFLCIMKGRPLDLCKLCRCSLM